MSEITKSACLNDVEVQACNAHNAVNHMYAGALPYGFHLKQVADLAQKFSYEIPIYAFYQTVAAAWLHDVMEDCRWTYNDVARATSKDVAEIVFALTDELGRNRQERKQRTLPKIAANRLAVFVKLCDRIANSEYSKNSLDSAKSQRMFKVYCAEYPAFKAALYQHGEYPQLWAYCDQVHNFS